MNLLDRLVAIWKQEQPGEALPKPGMERRTFLKILGGSAAVAAAVPFMDLEALLWTPKPIILAPDIALGNVLLTADLVAREALRMLKNNLMFVNAIDREYRDKPLRIGQHGMSGQFAVDCFAMPKEMPLKIARQDFIKPMADHLANALTLKGVKTFGALEIPSLVKEGARATDMATGLSVRAIQDGYFDRVTGDYREVLRLDVLGGA